MWWGGRGRGDCNNGVLVALLRMPSAFSFRAPLHMVMSQYDL